MKCNEFRGRLDQLLDKRLDPELDWMLTSHADDCEACRRELSGQQLLREAMDLFDHPELSNSFADNVATVALQQRQSTRRRNSQLLWFAGLAVAASLLVGFFVLSPNMRQRSVEDQVGRKSNVPVGPRSGTRNARQRQQLGLFEHNGSLPRGVEPQHRLPSKTELISLKNIESDEIPGVRPLKTSFGVTISLLKRTIPGKSSSTPKDPATSQIITGWRYTV